MNIVTYHGFFKSHREEITAEMSCDLAKLQSLFNRKALQMPTTYEADYEQVKGLPDKTVLELLAWVSSTR